MVKHRPATLETESGLSISVSNPMLLVRSGVETRGGLGVTPVGVLTQADFITSLGLCFLEVSKTRSTDLLQISGPFHVGIMTLVQGRFILDKTD